MAVDTGGAANKGLPNCRRGELDRCYIPVARGVFTERKRLDRGESMRKIAAAGGKKEVSLEGEPTSVLLM
ncbi:MAG: hypothetical protein ACOX5M_02175 [Bacillota bacterium]